MAETVLFFIHYALLLAFGISLSFAYCGIDVFSKKSTLTEGVLFLFCGLLQLFGYFVFDEKTVWEVYPLITHLPLVLFLFFYYKKRFITALAAVLTAYLCCQPANWVGIIFSSSEKFPWLESLVRIVFLVISGIVFLKWFSPCLSEIFQKDTRSIVIFGSVPAIYYVFDYITGIYNELIVLRIESAMEFLTLFICFTFLCFCVVYYKEYEQKAEAERKEQLIRISVEQQAKEIEAVRKSEEEIRLLRHDMRLLLSALSVCIDQNETEKAKELLASYISHIEQTKFVRFCGNDTLNYVLSDFLAKCRAENITFEYDINVEKIEPDEVLFCSVISNALDNAFNAQIELPPERRSIRFLMKSSGGKILVSVKNPVKEAPVFVDGIPVTNRKGHGYGTQSIRYMTEKLGGNSQFLFEDGVFSIRVII